MGSDSNYIFNNLTPWERLNRDTQTLCYLKMDRSREGYDLGVMNDDNLGTNVMYEL